MIMPGQEITLPPLRAPSRVTFLAVAIVFPLILLIVAFGLVQEQKGAQAALQASRVSYDRRLWLAEMISSLKDAESGQNGYVITGNRAFLSPYLSAQRNVADRYAGLVRAYRGDDPSLGRLATLKDVTERRFAEMAAVIRLRNSIGPRAADEKVADGRGQQLMASARRIVNELSDAEDVALERRQQQVRDRALRTLHQTWLLVAAIALLLCTTLLFAWRAARHRYKLEREGRNANARLRAIFDSTLDAIVILNPSGTIESMNAAAIAMFGFTPEELTRADVSVILDIANGDGSFHQRIGLQGDVLAEPWRVDRIAHRKDGTSVPVDVALGMMPLPDGLHIVAALRNASERKAIERMKDEFISTVSHELRTPLTSVVGSLGLLRAGSAGDLPDTARRLIDIAESNSRRLIRLINDMLDIEKIGTGRMRFDMARVDLVEMIDAAVRSGEGLAGSRGVRLETVHGTDPVFVTGDSERLLQVASNLLSNAIRFSPEGGIVRIGVIERDGKAIVTIDDEGPGVPVDFRDRIFARFSQAGASGDPAGGSGLGLAISREIVRAHDGLIWFDDAPGGGARFAFSLRVLPETAALLEEGAPRLLLCESDLESAALLRKMLAEKGFETDLVHTVADMLSASRERRYAALLLDLNTPDGCGIDVIPAIRDHPETQSLPIIIITSGSHGAEEAVAGALDIADWLKRPVSAQNLARAVQRALDQSAAVQPTLLHIDDDRDLLEVVAAALDGHGRLLKATSLASARAVLSQEMPDIVILDLGLPDGSGAELLPLLVDSAGAAIPTIIYSAQDVPLDIERRVQAVLVKSRRSLPHLSHTIRTVLARAHNRGD